MRLVQKIGQASAKTWLTRIEPASNEPGREVLAFECSICEIVEIKILEVDERRKPGRSTQKLRPL
jgi:hypothetical protein